MENTWKTLAMRQHATIGRRQLGAAGLSTRQIDRRVASGELSVLHRGVYGIAGAPSTFEQRAMAACLATGGVASHRCAAALWKLRGFVPSVVEIAVRSRRRPELPGVTSHTTNRLGGTDRTELRGIPVTGPARTLLDLGAVAPEEAVESALEDALHRRLVSEQWIERLLLRTGRPGRDGTAVLRNLLAAREPGQVPTESVLEDELVRLLRRAGLPSPVRQHGVTVRGYRSVWIDLAYPADMVAIEAQSLTWHAGRASLQRDCEKYNLLVRLGWRVLVFTWHDVRRRSSQVVADVKHALCGGLTTATVVKSPQSS